MPQLNRQQQDVRHGTWDCASPAACVAEIHDLRWEHEEAFELLRRTLLALDGSRVFNMLEECRLRHGRLIRERARLTMTRWRDGAPAIADEAASCLIALLPHQLRLDEKLALLQSLREEAISRLPRSDVALTVVKGSDLSDIVARLVRLMRRAEEIPLPKRLLNLQSWLADADMAGLNAMAAETEHFIAAQRLATLMRHLGTLSRLRLLAAQGLTISVRAHLEVPTASVRLRFHPRFWHPAVIGAGPDLLARLQDLALLRPQDDHRSDFAAYALNALDTTESEKLRLLAATERLRAERVLRELHSQTVAARADIQAAIATAQHLLIQPWKSKVASEQVLAGCATQIEITQRAPLLMMDNCMDQLGSLFSRRRP